MDFHRIVVIDGIPHIVQFLPQGEKVDVVVAPLFYNSEHPRGWNFASLHHDSIQEAEDELDEHLDKIGALKVPQDLVEATLANMVLRFTASSHLVPEAEA